MEKISVRQASCSTNECGSINLTRYVLLLLMLMVCVVSTNALAQSNDPPVALLPVQNESKLTPEEVMAQAAALIEASNANKAAPKATTQATVQSAAQVAGQASVTAQPTNEWSGYATAEAMAVNGNPEVALKQLEARLVTVPEDAKAAYIKGMILMQLGRVDDAERWFKMMQSNFPDLPQSYNALAVIYAAQDDYYAAETTLRALLEKHPNHQKARLNLANIYLNLAEMELENALKEAPNDAMISNTLQSLQALRQ